MKKILLFNALLLCYALGFCQAPNISYTSPQNYVAGTAITPLLPVNSGGAVPVASYGVVSTYAGTGSAGSVNATGTSASFNGPRNTCFDAAGNMYVADAVNNLVRKITPAGAVSTFAGSGNAVFADGTGTAASFKSPLGLVADAGGNIYVADAGNNRIRKITPAGEVSTIAGDGVADFKNGNGTAASFYNPGSLVFDAAGNLYVADINNNMIRKITPAGAVSTFAGGSQGYANGTGTAAAFNLPYGITIDAAGNFYVADRNNNVIRKISPAGVVSTFAGTSVQGSGNGGPSAASFNNPMGITIDVLGNLYVADFSGNQIRMITPAGITTTLAGKTSGGINNGTGTDATFNAPIGVTYDGLGNLYVSDYLNNDIRKITLIGYSIVQALPAGLALNASTGAISGTPTASSPATNYTVNVTNGQGNSSAVVNIAVTIPAVAPVVTAFSPASASVNGIISISGNNFLGATSVNIGGAAASFYVTSPSAINAIVPLAATSGNVSVTNSYGTSSLAGFTLLPAPVISYASPKNYTVGVAITPLAPTNSGGAVPGTPYAQVTTYASGFTSPRNTVFDHAGNMYVADASASLIRKVTPAGVVSTFAGGGTSGTIDGTGTSASFFSPTGIAIDIQDNIYVADANNHRIRKITPGAVVTTFAGSGTVGATDGTGTDATFNTPIAVAIDAAGNLYVADTYNYKIRKITPAGAVTTFAGNGTLGSTDGAGTAATFNRPNGLVVDAAGNIYVSDFANSKIRKITSAGVVSTLAGNGSQGALDGPGASASFYEPAGVAIDASGNLYIADAGNGKIRMITPAGVVSTLAGAPTQGLVNDIGVKAKFAYPQGVTMDSQGNLYVSDNSSNNVIRKISLTGYAISATLPDGLSFDASNGTISGTPTTISVPANYTISAYNSGGSGSAVLNLAVGILAVPPTLTAFTPSPAGLNGAITITGNNLLGATAVNIGGVDASFYVASNTQISAVVPAGAIAGSITVTNPYGTTTLTGFAILPKPVIAYNTPQSYVIGASIAPLTPTNTGGAVPSGSFGQVTTFVGTGSAGSANGVGTAASLYGPRNTAFDAAGNMYIADASNNLIRKVTPAGVVTTLAGNVTSGYADGTGAAAYFNNPIGIAVDAAGNVFVSDANNNRIRKITSAGVVTTFAGSGALASNEGTGTAASFADPAGIAFDAVGNLYVADIINNKIRKISPAGVVSTYAGNGSQGTANGAAASATFNFPYGVTVDAAGNVYVADKNNHMIRKISQAGVVSTLAGNGSQGATNGTGANASFNNPIGIAHDALGNIYIGDFNSNQIRMITPDGVVSTLAGSTTAGVANGSSTTATFNGPMGVTADGAGNLYVSDYLNNDIRKIKITGYTISPALPAGLSFDNNTGTISGTPTVLNSSKAYTVIAYNISGGNSTTLNIAVTVPQAPVINYDGPKTYVQGTSIAPLIPSSTGGAVPATTYGAVSFVAGSSRFSGKADGTGSAATFGFPTGIATDSQGNVYVADKGNNLVRKVTAAGVVTTFAGSSSLGAGNGVGTAATFRSPNGLTVDAQGNVFVADQGNNLIRKITPAGLVSTFAGSGNIGSANGAGASASFNNPTGVAADSQGNIFVVDWGNNLIRKITPAGVVSTFAGSTSPGFVNGTGTTARFNNPWAITIDAQDNIYVADRNNFVVRKVDQAGVVSTLAGSGATGSANGLGTAASFFTPLGLTTDLLGNVYVADTYNNLIRKITPAGEVSTVAGSGSSGLADATGTSATFNQPMGIAADITGNVYILDGGNNIIRKVIITGYTISPALPAGLIFDAATGTVSGTPTTAAPAATYTITAYNMGGSSTATIGITVINPQTITFPVIAAVTYGSADINPAATASSSLPVSYSSSNTAVATITANGNIHIVAAGTTTITATQAGNQAYNAATPVSQTLIVNPAALTITADNKTRVYGSANPALTVSYTGFVNSDDAAKLATAPAIGTTAIASSPVNTYVIMASGAASPNYTISYVNGSLTITPAALTVKADNISRTYGLANPALTASYTGFVNGDDASKLTNAPTVTTTALASSPVSTYPITAGGAASPNYTITYTQGTLTITPAALIVTADNKSRDYGMANPVLTVTYAGFVNGDTQASLTTAPTALVAATTTTAPGKYPITVSGGSSVNYTFTYTSGILTIVPLTNANLSALSVSDGTLSPVFASATLAYTINVLNQVSSISIIPTFDATATATVNGTTAANGSTFSNLALNVGDNIITVIVTAQDGITKKTYTLNAHRGVAAESITATNILTPNGDGKNDKWVIKDIQLYPENNVAIYDRAGRTVYTKKGYNNEWDGTLENAPLTQGTYYYTVQLGPGLPLIKGYITILRSRK